MNARMGSSSVSSVSEGEYEAVSADEHLVELEPTREVIREDALKKLAAASRELADAKVAYEAALYRARDVGCPNTVIARTLGRTEAAIRMFFKRSEK